MVTRVLSLFLALLAMPAAAAQRGDNRNGQGGQPVTCRPGSTAYSFTSACGLIGCEYVSEQSQGWNPTTGVCKTEYVAAEHGDYWTDRIVLPRVKTDDYSCELRHLYDITSEFQDWQYEAPGTEIDWIQTQAGCDLDWPGLAGRSYSASIDSLSSLVPPFPGDPPVTVELHMVCGTIVRDWRSTDAAPNPMPQLALTADAPCTLAIDVLLVLDHDHAATQPLQSSTIQAIVSDWPTPAQGGGCGIGGPELLAAIALWRARQRMKGGA